MTASGTSVDEQMSLLMRGVEYGDPNIEATMRGELRQRLAEGRPLRVYCGFDPTFTQLTLGNLVPMLKMAHFQRLGHEVTFLIGTMTGIVGDPTDKSAARQMLTVEEVEVNAQTWLRQAFRVLDPDKTIVRRNGDWLAPLTLNEVVHLASNFTVAQFLEHETFRNRMAESKPLYIHEFIYALMQAYDAHELQADVELGGIDQLFNIMAGRSLQKALGERPLIAVTTPLLIGTDGALKMSKSVGNFVGLDEPPAEMYGKIMSIPDHLIGNYFTLLTDVSNEEVATIEAEVASRSLNPMQAKKRLAYEIVAMLYGAEAANSAQGEFERVFQRREEPEEAQELPLELDANGNASVDITQVVTQAGAVESRSAARRLLAQGAIAIDGAPVSNAQVELHAGSLVRVGRHRFLRVVAAGAS